MKSKFAKPNITELFEAIILLEDVEECYAFFEDICTITEIQSLASRWQVARLLDDGKTYMEIGEITKVSTATISRVSRFLNYGAGGYRLMIDKMKVNEGEDKHNERS